MKNIFYFLSVLLFSTTVDAQIFNAQNQYGSGTPMQVDVQVNNLKDSVYFTISGPNNKWFGIAFGTTVMNGYAIILNNNGGNPVEYTMNGNGAPTLQASQNLEGISSSVSGSTKTFTFKRAKNTQDANDFTFVGSATNMSTAWAIGSGVNLAYHGPNKGAGSLTFTNACPTLTTNTETEIELCEGESVDIFGITQNTSGIYSDTVLSYLGCDSIITNQSLTVNSLADSNYSYSLCAGDTFDFFGQTLTEAGTYTDTLDCKIHNLTISFLGLTAGLNWSNSSLNTENPFAENQWYNCDSNAIIDGATNISYSPTTPGNYAVISSFGSCSDTSDCFEVTNIHLSNKEILNGADLFNIENNILKITAEKVSNLSIVNIQGKELLSTKSKLVDLNSFKNGIYILTVEIDNTYFSKKIIL